MKANHEFEGGIRLRLSAEQLEEVATLIESGTTDPLAMAGIVQDLGLSSEQIVQVADVAVCIGGISSL